MKLFRFGTILLLVLVAIPSPVGAGHSRHVYCDGGQSADGRYVVTATLVEVPARDKKAASSSWQFTWLDTQTKATQRGPLAGLRTGTSDVFEPVHAHLFVAPNGETFAVWNPNVMAPTTPANAKWPDLTSKAARDWEGFTHRLTIYKKNGEVVQRLDLKDFLNDDDWAWLFCYGRQIYWQANYAPLTRDNAPRVGYALYRISPNYTILETQVGATSEAIVAAKKRGVTPPTPRTVRVDLTTGKRLDPTTVLTEAKKIPGRPFQGDPIMQGGRNGMKSYLPSLDPVRLEGRWTDKP